MSWHAEAVFREAGALEVLLVQDRRECGRHSVAIFASFLVPATSVCSAIFGFKAYTLHATLNPHPLSLNPIP